jgi:hypothetical protein
MPERGRNFLASGVIVGAGAKVFFGRAYRHRQIVNQLAVFIHNQNPFRQIGSLGN